MIDRKTLIGKTFPDIKYVVSKSDRDDFFRICQIDDPKYGNINYAKVLGLKHFLIPPSFAQVIAGVAFFKTLRDLDNPLLIDWEKDTVFNGGQEFIHKNPLSIETEYIISGSIPQVEEKTGKKGSFDIIDIGSICKDITKKEIFVGTIKIIVLK